MPAFPRPFRAWALFSAGVMTLVGGGASAPVVTAVGRPNVLFIAIDDLNSSVAGMKGESTFATPHINRLAARGVLFTNAHCAAPACNPSRVSVMTGLAPASSGVYLNSQDWRENVLLKTRTTLPMHFKNNGYVTLGGGKLYHASSLSEDRHTGYLDARPWDDYFPSKTQQMPFEVTPASYPVQGMPGKYAGRFDWAPLDIAPDEMADAKVVAWASEQLMREHDRPLFLAVGIYRPHIPWWLPQRYFDQNPLEDVVLPEVMAHDLDDVPEAGRAMARRSWQQWMVEKGQWANAVQGYQAAVNFADDMVGRLLTALDNGPMAKNTIVVLWSDHGYHLGQKEHWEKFALWEQTTRVPLIFATPEGMRGGETCDAPVSLLDLYPTLSALCGLDSPETMDGENLMSLLRDPKRPTERSVVSTQGRLNHAVRSAEWRYIRYADGSEELYDQVRDPRNFHNLAARPDYQEVKRELARRLPRFNAESDPVMSGE